MRCGYLLLPKLKQPEHKSMKVSNVGSGNCAQENPVGVLL